MTAASRERLPFTFLSLSLISVLSLAIIMGVFQWTKVPVQRTNFSDVISVVVDALATASVFKAAQHSAARSKRLALAWGIIGLAMLIFTLGDITWSFLEIGLNKSPFPSLADGFYFAYYPVFLVGVILLIRKPEGRGELFSRVLDLITILAAGILGFWNFLIGPMLQSSAQAPLLEQILASAYPVGDLVLFSALLLILYNETSEQQMASVYMLAAGIVIMIVADCTFGYQSLAGTYVSGGLLDLAWITGILLFGLAGASKWAAPKAKEAQGGNSLARPSRKAGFSGGDASSRRLLTIKTYLPYIWLFGALLLWFARELTPMPMSALSIAIGVGTIIVLVFVRQLITIEQNVNLNRQLQLQAAKLEGANQNLNLEIIERKRVQEELAFDALHDDLTGLANRALFLDRLGQALERSRRHPSQCFAVLFMDLDQFKVVNDSLGHAVGDQLLLSIAERMKVTLRSGDTIARFGGDEFAVLLDDLDDAGSAILLAERVQRAICVPFNLERHESHVSASIGIATNAIKYDRPEDLLRDADLAMYEAKALGKGRCEMFRVDMRDQAFSRLALEEQLRQGLLKREFRLYYQPIVSLVSDQIVGFEALLRWIHPTRGLLLPEEFLPVAEESGLILPISNWVLNEACRQMKTWQQHPHLQSASVSVNISDKQFSQPNLVDKVAQALEASGLNGAGLKLEITEQVLVRNNRVASHLMVTLQDMGVQVHIDDFGTGYSALAYLQQFPINAIKIDKAFINDMNKDRKGLGLVRAIVSMAHELGMEAIAEGIETVEQLRELKGLLCGYGQGSLLAEPMDAASLERILPASHNGKPGFS
jgi:diguanylate cyclase (GGDEF)-like protein